MIQGDEPFHAGGESIGQTVLDFWRWAGADLLGNVWRGVLAEFLIARALDVTHEPRLEWAPYDLRTRSGVTVEVKSASYRQSWQQSRPSNITFDIAPRKQEWNSATNEMRTLVVPRRLADVYVFCLLGREDLAKDDTDPLDVDQWAFYVAARALLDRQHPRQRTIGINPLRTMMRRTAGHEAAEVRYRGLAEAIEAAGQKAAGFSG